MPAGEVEVWRVPLTGSREELEALRSCLTDEERSRADRFRFPADQERFTRCRAALRHLLGFRLGSSPADVRLAYGPNGKPALEVPELGARLRFNASHSDGLALIALTDGAEVGVDLERVRAVPDAAAIVGRYFSAPERESFGRLPDERREVGFFELWTRKEAYLKGRGDGLSRPLDEPPPLSSEWDLRLLELGAGYVGALAVRGRPERVRLRDWGLKNG